MSRFDRGLVVLERRRDADISLCFARIATDREIDQSADGRHE